MNTVNKVLSLMAVCLMSAQVPAHSLTLQGSVQEFVQAPNLALKAEAPKSDETTEMRLLWDKWHQHVGKATFKIFSK